MPGLDDVIKQAIGGQVDVESARMASFIQLAQFATTARPKIFTVAGPSRLQHELDRIHDAGGVVISVDFKELAICAYMPEDT